MKRSNNFNQLTLAQRQIIETGLRQGLTQRSIALQLGVDKSTVSREINHHSRQGTYWADLAQAAYRQARKQCHPKKKIDNDLIVADVRRRIEKGWSPEEISGRLKLEISLGQKTPNRYVGYETIYKLIYESDYGQREKLSQYLKRGKNHRTKQHGRKAKKTLIPNKVSIDLRPKVANQRLRIGDWESDSIIYPYKKAINSLVDRKILLTLLTKLLQKTAAETMRAVVGQLQKLPVKTITFDNGSENVLHQQVGQALGADTYFCHPYHSWEKGTNENTNGLVRRYLPRGRSIDDLTQTELDDIARELNHRPRKKLGYYTPAEMLKLAGYKLVSCNQI